MKYFSCLLLALLTVACEPPAPDPDADGGRDGGPPFADAEVGLDTPASDTTPAEERPAPFRDALPQDARSDDDTPSSRPDASHDASPDASHDAAFDVAFDVADVVGGCTPGATRPCYSGPQATRDRGVCRAGTQVCGPMGAFGEACLGERLPEPVEACGNAVDDDCDGEVDEGCGGCTPGTTRACYSGTPETRGVGSCRVGVQVCSPTGAFASECLGEQLPASSERCGNAIDDDCDGIVDEECGDCTPGTTRACYTGPSSTREVGRCRSGTQRCGTDRRWTVECTGEVLPSTESCDAVDDDCNGTVDDDPSASLCTVSNAVGACRMGACTVGMCRAGFADCDGTAANGCEADLNSPASCGRCGNTCRGGQACSAGSCVDPTVGGVGALAMGDRHACVVLAGGRVACWGAAADGRLGAGALARSTSTPTYVIGLESAIDLGAGTSHTCAVTTSGTVYCWGKNESGQLGDGTTESRASPVAVPDLGEVIQVALGVAHSCVLRRGGTVACWGANGMGQLGDGTTLARLVLTEVLGLGQVARIAAGDHHTCALLSDGTMRCWGINTSGQLGDGSSVTRLRPAVVAGLTNATALAAGATHTCAVIGSGAVRCWGANEVGQLGDGTLIQHSTPVSPVGLNGITELAAGRQHTCARKTDGSVWCWGQNLDRQIGTDSSTRVTTPGSVVSRDVLHVAAGGNSSCSVETTGRTICWGRNDEGQLGDATRLSRALPGRPIFGLSGGLPCAGETCNLPVFASPGDSATTCAFRPGGLVACWGRNTVTRSVVSRRFGPQPDDFVGVRALSIGHDGVVCALDPGGTVRCRAAGGTEAVAVQGLSDATEVGTGAGFACVRRAGGLVGCWGRNDLGQLGDGTSTPRTAPSLVGGVAPIEGVTALAVGSNFACALRAGGTVWCWGSNERGQLGNGRAGGHSMPVQVVDPSSGQTFLSGVTQISAGAQHACALSAGTVRCWGYNANGQLGDGSTVDHLRPTAVVGLRDIVSVSAGATQTCALRMGGTVRCWGANGEGGLGDGTAMSRLLPVEVMGLSDVRSIATGGNYACARLLNGAVRCWGSNGNGEVGDGTGFPALLPRGPIFGLP